MRTSALIGAIALAASAVASPPGRSKSRDFVDKFDDRLALLPGLSPVGNTAGGALNYRAWEYVTGASGLIVKPASGGNTIASGVDAQLKEGEPAFFKKDNVECFSLTSIAFACALNGQQGLAGTVEPCTIQLSGQPAFGNGGTVTTTLVYNKLGVAQPMMTKTLPKDFDCLSNVDVDVIQALTVTSPALLSPVLDSVAYKAYYKA